MLIDWFTVFAQIVNFLILVVLLKHFLYKPVLDALDAREKGIAATIADAKKRMDDAQKLKEEFEHKNEDFEKQRAAQTAAASESVKKERDHLMDAARRDSEDLRAKLNQAVTAEKDSLKKKLEVLVQEQVISVSRKALYDLADVSLEDKMTNSLVHQLHDMKDPSRKDFAANLHNSSPIIVMSSLEMDVNQRTAITDEVKILCGNGSTPQIDFQIKPGLISGIEVITNGQKIGWNIDQYLTALNESMDQLLAEKPTAKPTKA